MVGWLFFRWSGMSFSALGLFFGESFLLVAVHGQLFAVVNAWAYGYKKLIA
jgi:hypothetical protein